jgi:hypothetical protein
MKNSSPHGIAASCSCFSRGNKTPLELFRHGVCLMSREISMLQQALTSIGN